MLPTVPETRRSGYSRRLRVRFELYRVAARQVRNGDLAGHSELTNIHRCMTSAAGSRSPRAHTHGAGFFHGPDISDQLPARHVTQGSHKFGVWKSNCIVVSLLYSSLPASAPRLTGPPHPLTYGTNFPLSDGLATTRRPSGSDTQEKRDPLRISG